MSWQRNANGNAEWWEATSGALIVPTPTPIALTSILSQDGRGGKRKMGSRLRGSKRGEGDHNCCLYHNRFPFLFPSKAGIHPIPSRFHPWHHPNMSF